MLAIPLALVSPASVAAGAPRPIADGRPQVIVVTSGPATDSATRAGEQLAAQSQEQGRWWRKTGSATTTSMVTLPPRTAEMIVAAEAQSALQAAAPAVQTPAPTATPLAVPAAAASTPAKARPMSYVETSLGAGVPAKIKQYEELIQRSAREYNVDPNFIAAVIMTESSGDPEAVSPKNAIGLMQVLDGPSDPEENIAAGTRMLARWLKYFGQVDLALAAYNAGPGNVLEHNGVPPFPETHNHIARTLARYAAYSAGAAA